MATKYNPHAGHRERMRQDFLEHSFNEATPPEEILEMLLYYSIHVADTKKIAYELLDRFETVANVLEASYDELLQVPGISEVSACLLQMIMPVARYCADERLKKGTRLRTPREIGDFLVDRFQGLRVERVLLICMDGEFRILAVEPVPDLGIGFEGVTPQAVGRVAVRAQSFVVVLAHNHPNNVITPSPYDKEMTRTLCLGMRELGIRFADHFLIGRGKYLSMASQKEYQHLFELE